MASNRETEDISVIVGEREPLLLAALDLGSNSFHMLIARVVDGDIHVVDRLRDPVRLAGGMDENDRLSEKVQSNALECLERIGQRLRHLRDDQVRVVGTNTLRRASNARAFRVRAETALGRRIEIITGQEEARLIHLGVAHDNFREQGQRLVIDIGGGSTEIIVGKGFEVIVAHSLFMGCVHFSSQFFPNGIISDARFNAARTAAGLELHTLSRQVIDLGWDSCIGASGTILAVHELLRVAGWCGNEITREGLDRLRKAMIDLGSTARLMDLPGMKEDRVPVLPGGLAILIQIFDSLRLERISCSMWALREGLIYDLIGRIRHEDVRDRTIRRMIHQYRVDLQQAARVERTALDLLQQIESRFNRGEIEDMRLTLAWAARLHEVGLTIAYPGYHKHGAYLLEHSVMPGFSADDQDLLGILVRNHRRKLERDRLADAPASWASRIRMMCMILRLAALLNRGRVDEPTPRLTIKDEGHGKVRLEFEETWLQERPLTRADLELEVRYLAQVGFALKIATRSGVAK